MKSRLILLGLLILTQTVQGQDFRNITWGMSIDEVRAAEGRELKKLGTGLYYYKMSAEETGGWDVSVRFHEYDGQVLQGAIIISFPAMYEQHFELYARQKNEYSRYYGEPERDEVVWLDETYKDTPDKQVSALLLGDLVYQTDWRSDTSLIRMTLRDWDMIVYLTVYYRSLEHQQLVEEDDKEQFDFPGDEIYNGFTRYSQDEIATTDEAWGESEYAFQFNDHSSDDHLLWGTHPIYDHSLDALNSELAAVKKAIENLDCSPSEQERCDYMDEVKADLEGELAKRK